MFVKQLDANGETNVDAVKCFLRTNESLIFIHLAFEFTRYKFVSMMIIYPVNGWLSFDQFASFATSFYVNYIVFTAFEWYFSTDIIERTRVGPEYFVYLLTTLMLETANGQHHQIFYVHVYLINLCVNALHDQYSFTFFQPLRAIEMGFGSIVRRKCDTPQQHLCFDGILKK